MLTNTIVKEFAVMVNALYAPFTRPAMITFYFDSALTNFAEFNLIRVTRLFGVSLIMMSE